MRKPSLKPNRSGKLLPGLAYDGFFTLKRQATTSTIRRMDRLTGGDPQSPPPRAPSPVGLRTNLSLPQSSGSDNLIVLIASLLARDFNLLKTRSIMAGLSFVAAIGMFVGTACLSGERQG